MLLSWSLFNHIRFRLTPKIISSDIVKLTYFTVVIIRNEREWNVTAKPLSKANNSKQIHHHQNFYLVRDPVMVSEISKQAKSISKHPLTRMSRAIVQRRCRNSCTTRERVWRGHVRTDRVQESSHVVRQDAITEKGLTPTNAPEVFRRTDLSTGITRNPTPFTLIWYCSVHGLLMPAGCTSEEVSPQRRRGARRTGCPRNRRCKSNQSSRLEYKYGFLFGSDKGAKFIGRINAN